MSKSKMVLLSVLTIFFLIQHCAESYPCGTSCCESNCSEECCSHSTTSCCTRSVSSCCDNIVCKEIGCKRTQCRDCDETTTVAPTVRRPTNNTTESAVPCNRAQNSNCSSINTNNNNITIPTHINIQNEIRNEARITVPINVDVSNVNNIQILPAPKTHCAASNNSCSATHSVTNNTLVVDEIGPEVPYVNVSTKTSTLKPDSSTRFIPTAPTTALPSGCCRIVMPCQPYSYCGCQTSRIHCSQFCQNQYMYQPINVCQNGCYRRNTAMGSFCGYNGCYRQPVDCSSCGNSFYTEYNSFMMCSGCFVPMPWSY